jgi:hypothetical protein
MKSVWLFFAQGENANMLFVKAVLSSMTMCLALI